VSTDERDSQLSAMFDGELPDSECELLARRLSRDPALKQQWARYSLIGAVIRDEPVHARRAASGRLLDAGIAARLAAAIEAEDAALAGVSQAAPAATGEDAAAAVPAARFTGTTGASGRWVRPAAGVAIAASVAALSVFWLQARSPAGAPMVAQSTGVVAREAAAGDVEVIAPPAATRGVAAEVVVAGNGYPAPVARGGGSGEPESYVVPLPSESRGVAAPAQLANYVVAHSEYSAPLSRRSLLSALVAADAPAGSVVVAPGPAVEGGSADPDVATDGGAPAPSTVEAAK